MDFHGKTNGRGVEGARSMEGRDDRQDGPAGLGGREAVEEIFAILCCRASIK